MLREVSSLLIASRILCVIYASYIKFRHLICPGIYLEGCSSNVKSSFHWVEGFKTFLKENFLFVFFCMLELQSIHHIYKDIIPKTVNIQN